MLGGQTVKPRDEFVYARIVFHGAGAQWVHTEVNRVIPGGKAGKMAQDFDLAELGKTLDAFATMVGAESVRRVNGGHVERRQIKSPFARRRFFEKQPFVLADVARGLGHRTAHCRSCGRVTAMRSADTNFSMSDRAATSVTHTSAWLLNSGYEALSARGPIIPSRSKCLFTASTGLGSTTVNSLKNGASKPSRTPGILSSSLRAKCALDRFCSAISRSPSLPSSARCTVAARAHNA